MKEGLVFGLPTSENVVTISKDIDKPCFWVTYPEGKNLIVQIKYVNKEPSDFAWPATVYTIDVKKDDLLSKNERDTLIKYRQYLKKLGISQDEFMDFLLWYGEEHHLYH